MRFEIVIAPRAVQELRELPARLRSEIRDALERYLRSVPTRTSKSRIKRLRGMARPQYRLRVGETRVFYDVREKTVEILAIVANKQAQKWLEEQGAPDEDGGAGQGEG